MICLLYPKAKGRPTRWIEELVRISPVSENPRTVPPDSRAVFILGSDSGVSPTWAHTAVARLAEGFDCVRASRFDQGTRFVVHPKHIRSLVRRQSLARIWSRVAGLLFGMKPADFWAGPLVISGSAYQRFLVGHHQRSHFAIQRDLERGGAKISNLACEVVTFPHLAHMLTADDWGLSPAVNDGILLLVRSGVLGRVSVLADGDHVGYRLDELKAQPGVEISLHFNLTYRKKAANPMGLLLALISGQLSDDEIRREFLRQHRVLAGFGLGISHLDGHHHCHVFPRVLAALGPVLGDVGIRQVRIPYDPRSWPSRRAIINLFCVSARRHLKTLDVATQPFFYPTSQHLSSPSRLVRALSRRRAAEVLVHPATHVDFDQHQITDPYREGRVREFETLSRLP